MRSVAVRSVWDGFGYPAAGGIRGVGATPAGGGGGLWRFRCSRSKMKSIKPPPMATIRPATTSRVVPLALEGKKTCVPPVKMSSRHGSSHGRPRRKVTVHRRCWTVACRQGSHVAGRLSGGAAATCGNARNRSLSGTSVNDAAGAAGRRSSAAASITDAGVNHSRWSTHQRSRREEPAPLRGSSGRTRCWPPRMRSPIPHTPSIGVRDPNTVVVLLLLAPALEHHPWLLGNGPTLPTTTGPGSWGTLTDR